MLKKLCIIFISVCMISLSSGCSQEVKVDENVELSIYDPDEYKSYDELDIENFKSPNDVYQYNGLDYGDSAKEIAEIFNTDLKDTIKGLYPKEKNKDNLMTGYAFQVDYQYKDGVLESLSTEFYDDELCIVQMKFNYNNCKNEEEQESKFHEIVSDFVEFYGEYEISEKTYIEPYEQELIYYQWNGNDGSVLKLIMPSSYDKVFPTWSIIEVSKNKSEIFGIN